MKRTLLHDSCGLETDTRHSAPLESSANSMIHCLQLPFIASLNFLASENQLVGNLCTTQISGQWCACIQGLDGIGWGLCSPGDCWNKPGQLNWTCYDQIHFMQLQTSCTLLQNFTWYFENKICVYTPLDFLISTRRTHIWENIPAHSLLYFHTTEADICFTELCT